MWEKTDFYGAYWQCKTPAEIAIIAMLGDDPEDYMARSCVKWLLKKGVNVLTMSPGKKNYSHHNYPLERIEIAIAWLKRNGNKKIGIAGASTTFSAVLLSVKRKYTVAQARAYYRNAMCENFLTKMASKKGKAYTEKGREKLKQQAKQSESITNPYSWKFTIEDGETINQYTATFYTCGICYLMKKLGLKEYIPAMCTLDYDMAELGNTVFTREYTLAGGGKYCDCHYDHKGKK